MIIYFSGTGNSRHIAESLGMELDENVRRLSISEASSISPDGRTLGFVFPIYSWGVPPIVNDFIGALSASMLSWARNCPVWAVLVCGDEVALAPEMLKRTLKNAGLHLSGGWSIQMPNNYVILPGFDVDPKDVEKQKLTDSTIVIRRIAEKIRGGKWEEDYVRGNLKWMKSKLIYPLFKRWGINAKNWLATDACVGCGLCEKNCPTSNIRLKERKPQWGSNCTSCLGCYHICPRNAIQYSTLTRRKGQYYYPENKAQNL